MRQRFALSLVIVGGLLVGANFAQDAPPVANSPETPKATLSESLFGLLGDPVQATDAPPEPQPYVRDSVSDAPPATADEPVANPFDDGPARGRNANIGAQGLRIIDFADGTSPADRGPAGLPGNAPQSRVFAEPENGNTWFDFTAPNFSFNNNPGEVDLNVSIDGGRITVRVNGQTIPSDQIQQNGSTLHIHDSQGRVITTIDVSGDGRVTIPSGWSFRGPAKWTTQTQSRNVIGIRAGSIESSLARHLGLGEGEGILITEVVEGHPAAAAGMQGHDVIIAIEGRRPATLERLKASLQSKQAGARISLTVVRAGQTIEIRSGISTVSAPVSSNQLPSGSYAFGFGGVPAADPKGNVPAPTLFWQRSGNVTTGRNDSRFGLTPVDPAAGTLFGGWGDSGSDARNNAPKQFDPAEPSGGHWNPAGRRQGTTTLPGATGSNRSGGVSTNEGSRGGLSFGGRVVDPAGRPVTGGGISTRTALPSGVRTTGEGPASPFGGTGMYGGAPTPPARDLEKIEERLEKLENLLEQLIESQMKSRSRRPSSVRVTPKVDGTVLAVRDGAVVLSVGEADGLAKGDEFVLYTGDKFVGKVRVHTLEEELAVANVLYLGPAEKVAEGQSATTRLGSDLWSGDDTKEN